jgi:CRP-like cAMP-binding protein
VLPGGAPLFLEDEVGRSLFIVRSGTVRVSRREAGAERQLVLLGPGDHLGALAVLAPCVRLVSAVAATACEVLEITHDDFARKAPEKPQACLKLALAVAADLGRQVGECRDALRDLVPSRNPP